MVSIPLNEQITLNARYNVQADTIAIEVQYHAEQAVWFEDQSFSVKSFIYHPESQKWEEFDLGFYVGDPQPRKVEPNASRLDAYYPVPTRFTEIDDGTVLRLFVAGCLDDSCHPDSTRVGAYTDVVVDTMANGLQPLSTDSKDERRISNSFLLATDLPAGWFRGRYDTLEEQGETIHLVVFAAHDQPGLENIAHQLILYPDETQALEVFQRSKILGQESTYDETLPEINVQSRADGFRIECLNVPAPAPPQKFCVAVARYDRLISVLTTYVHDDEQWFSWIDLERLLTAMDRRALDARGD